MEIIEVKEVSDNLINAMKQLIPQLAPAIAPPTRANLEEIVASSSSHLFIALDRNHSGRIVGTLTLAVYRIPVGVKAWVEDLVVDGNARGQGVATALIHAALKRAAELGAHEVNLTSAPWREAANRLYLHLGFIKSGTNVYNKTTKEDQASKA
jgi:GNAT superfamily N-acetyltransferase